VVEWAHLEIDQHVAAQQPMIEYQINEIMLPADRDPFLPRLETEAAAEFEQKILEMIQQRPLQLALRVFRQRGQSGKLQHVRIADEIGDLLRRLLAPRAFDHGFLVGGQAGALIEEAADLPLELADGPVALEALVLEESSLPWVGDGDEFDEFGP